MGNRVLDTLVQGANAVNQASQNTTQTLGLMDQNTARQAQARQAYTQQTLSALNQFQQAQMEENKLMIQKTFDVQNQYLNSLITSNNNFMNQRKDALDLDLKIEQLKQDKVYKDKAYILDKIKTNSYVKLAEAQANYYNNKAIGKTTSTSGLTTPTEAKKTNLDATSDAMISGDKSLENKVKTTIYSARKGDYNGVIGSLAIDQVKVMKDKNGNVIFQSDPDKIYAQFVKLKSIENDNFALNNIKKDPNAYKMYQLEKTKIMTIEKTLKCVVNGTCKYDDKAKAIIGSLLESTGKGAQFGINSISKLQKLGAEMNINSGKLNRLLARKILPNIRLTPDTDFKKIESLFSATNSLIADEKTTEEGVNILSGFIEKNIDYLKNHPETYDAIYNAFKTSSQSIQFLDNFKDTESAKDYVKHTLGHFFEFPEDLQKSIADSFGETYQTSTDYALNNIGKLNSPKAMGIIAIMKYPELKQKAKYLGVDLKYEDYLNGMKYIGSTWKTTKNIFVSEKFGKAFGNGYINEYIRSNTTEQSIGMINLLINAKAKYNQIVQEIKDPIKQKNAINNLLINIKEDSNKILKNTKLTTTNRKTNINDQIEMSMIGSLVGGVGYNNLFSQKPNMKKKIIDLQRYINQEITEDMLKLPMNKELVKRAMYYAGAGTVVQAGKFAQGVK